MIDKFLKLYDEVVNLTSFFYALITSAISLYTLHIKNFAYFTPILLSISICYTYFSTPLYLFKFFYYFYKSFLIDKKSDDYIIYTKEKYNSIEYLFHHIMLIFLLLNVPKNELNKKFYLEFTCFCHLFEISTIPLSLLHSNILKNLILKNNKNLIEFFKLIFLLLFFGVRIFYLLPKIFMLLLKNNFYDDYSYKYTLQISFFFLSCLHLFWIKKLFIIIYKKYFEKKID